MRSATPHRRGSRLLALFLAAHLLVAPASRAWAQAEAPAQAGAEQVEPKFGWGILLNIAFKFALSAFSEWASKKLTTELTDNALDRLRQNSRLAPIVPIAKYLGFGAKSAGAVENARVGEPVTPLKVAPQGKENYQGMHVALVAFDPAGRPLGFRPLTDGFHSGQRFKLRVLATFDGLLVIDNINPKGERRQIFPAAAENALLVKAGTEILVPAAEQDYFEFTGAPGEEQLVLTLRDPRAKDGAASSAQVFRRDEAIGSNFVQETPPGSYPVIAQSIRFAHVR